MKRSIFLIFWLASAATAASQGTTTQQIDSLLNRAIGFRGSNADSIISITDRALVLSDNIRYSEGRAVALRWKALGLTLSGQEGSLPLLEESIGIFEDLDDPSGIAATRNTMATVYYHRGAYDYAAEQWHLSLSYYEGIRDSTGITNMWNNLGNLHRAMGQLDRSLAYNQGALAYRERGTDTLLIAGSLNNVANLLGEMGRYEEAITYHERGLGLNRAIGNRRSIGNSYINLGSVHLRNGNPRKALEYYRLAEGIRKSMNDNRALSSVYSGMADAFLVIGDADSAAFYASSGYDLALLTRSPREAREASNFAWQAYRQTGDNRAALRFLERHKALNDSLMSIENQRVIANLESVAELNRVREDVRALEIERHYDRQLAIALSLALVGAIIALLLIQRSRREVSRLAEQLRQAGAVKDKMFSILSHDLRRPMSSLKSLLNLSELDRLTSEEWDTYQGMIQRQFDVTDDTLKDLFIWANDQLKGVPPRMQQVPVADVVRENLSLLGPQADEKSVVIRNLVPDGVRVNTDRTYLTSILRNLLSNAIKFTPGGKSVTVDVREAGSDIRLEIRDEGIGIGPERLDGLFMAGAYTQGTNGETGSGFGLLFVRDLAERMGCRVEVQSEPAKGSVFSVVIPA